MSLNTIVMLTGVMVLLVSFWKRNDIPGNIAFHTHGDVSVTRHDCSNSAAAFPTTIPAV